MRALARNLENHDLCNKVTGQQHPFTAHAIMHGKPSLPDETFRRFRRTTDVLLALATLGLTSRSRSPTFLHFLVPSRDLAQTPPPRPTPSTRTRLPPSGPVPQRPATATPPPDPLTAYVTHDALKQMLDRFSTPDDPKAVLQQVPPLVQKAMQPAISAGIGPLVDRPAELEAKVLQLEGACLSLGERLTNMKNKYRHIESALGHDLKDFYRRNGLSAYAGFESALSGVARWDEPNECFREGDEVTLHGFTKAGMNGQVGRIGPHADAGIDRLPVVLSMGKSVAIKPANLRRTSTTPSAIMITPPSETRAAAG